MSYIPGGVYFICDRCSQKRRRTVMAREWTNLLVCRDTCFDPRPPQLDPPHVWPEGLPLSDIRPRPDDLVLTDNQVTADDL